MPAALIIAMTSAAGAQGAAPTAAVDGPATAATGVPVGFDAGASADPDGDPLDFAWAIDGQDLGVDHAWMSVSFAHPGRHVVTVTVTDPGGAASTVEHDVLVTGADRDPSQLSPIGTSVDPGLPVSPVLSVRAARAPVARHQLRVRVHCGRIAVCHGHLRAVALVGRGSHQHALLLAHRRFTLLRGTRLVHLRLGRVARTRLAAHGRVQVTAYRGSVRIAHIWATSIYRVR